MMPENARRISGQLRHRAADGVRTTATRSTRSGLGPPIPGGTTGARHHRGARCYMDDETGDDAKVVLATHGARTGEPLHQLTTERPAADRGATSAATRTHERQSGAFSKVPGWGAAGRLRSRRVRAPSRITNPGFTVNVQPSPTRVVSSRRAGAGTRRTLPLLSRSTPFSALKRARVRIVAVAGRRTRSRRPESPRRPWN